MNLGLTGLGRMGSEVERLARAEGHEIGLSLDEHSNKGGVGLTREALATIEVVIDFSWPHVVLENIRKVAEAGVPMVVGTTGWYEHLPEARKLVERHHTALVYGANFSIGANLFLKLAEIATELFEPFAAYDPYVFEHHHRDKVDAPSGTALRIAEAVLGHTERKKKLQIGNPKGKIDPEGLHVASLRAGGASGHHVLGFDSSGDSVEIQHRARNREGFARGALFAAEWVRDKKGVFDFAEVLDGGVR